MVFSAELRKPELVELRVTEILFGENLAPIVHALSLIDNLSRVAGLGVLSFALLRNDILLDSAINLHIVVPASDLVAILQTVANRSPVLVCSYHRRVWHAG